MLTPSASVESKGPVSGGSVAVLKQGLTDIVDDIVGLELLEERIWDGGAESLQD